MGNGLRVVNSQRGVSEHAYGRAADGWLTRPVSCRAARSGVSRSAGRSGGSPAARTARNSYESTRQPCSTIVALQSRGTGRGSPVSRRRTACAPRASTRDASQSMRDGAATTAIFLPVRGMVGRSRDLLLPSAAKMLVPGACSSRALSAAPGATLAWRAARIRRCIS